MESALELEAQRWLSEHRDWGTTVADFDRGQAALAELAARGVGSDLNEATTRRNVIDALLRDALGWPDDQVKCEEHVEGDYLDYVLGARTDRNYSNISEPCPMVPRPGPK